MSYKIAKKATSFTGQLFLKEDIIKILDPDVSALISRRFKMIILNQLVHVWRSAMDMIIFFLNRTGPAFSRTFFLTARTAE